MGVVERFRDYLSEQTDDRNRYTCRDCGAEFRSGASHPLEATCPDCGSINTRSTGRRDARSGR